MGGGRSKLSKNVVYIKNLLRRGKVGEEEGEEEEEQEVDTKLEEIFMKNFEPLPPPKKIFYIYYIF